MQPPVAEQDLVAAVRVLERHASDDDVARARRANALANALAVIAAGKAAAPLSWSPQAEALVRSPCAPAGRGAIA